MTRPVGGSPFVGRESELRRLRSAVGAAAGGQRRLVLVTGEPGIGKTRLVQKLAAHFAQAAPGGDVDKAVAYREWLPCS